MKKILIITLALVNSPVSAHSQSPINYGGKNNPLDAVTFTGIKTIPITVTNLNREPKRFQITVNDIEFTTTPKILSSEEKKLYVPVKLTQPGKVERFKICSTTMSKSTSYNTRICTVATLLWAEK